MWFVKLRSKDLLHLQLITMTYQVWKMHLKCRLKCTRRISIMFQTIYNVISFLSRSGRIQGMPLISPDKLLVVVMSIWFEVRLAERILHLRWWKNGFFLQHIDLFFQSSLIYFKHECFRFDMTARSAPNCNLKWHIWSVFFHLTLCSDEG